jgi:hypothetical protein
MAAKIALIAYAVNAAGSQRVGQFGGTRDRSYDAADLGEVLRVTDQWGDEIVLTEEDIQRIDAKRGDDIGRYLDEIRKTLESPSVVYEGRYADSKVFYGKDLLPENSPFRGCYVAVIVRYSTVPASIRTVYFPFNIAGKLGKLLDLGG